MQLCVSIHRDGPEWLLARVGSKQGAGTFMDADCATRILTEVKGESRHMTLGLPAVSMSIWWMRSTIRAQKFGRLSQGAMLQKGRGSGMRRASTHLLLEG